MMMMIERTSLAIWKWCNIMVNPAKNLHLSLKILILSIKENI
jgi:hypothetical protein